MESAVNGRVTSQMPLPMSVSGLHAPHQPFEVSVHIHSSERARVVAHIHAEGDVAASRRWRWSCRTSRTAVPANGLERACPGWSAGSGWCTLASWVGHGTWVALSEGLFCGPSVQSELILDAGRTDAQRGFIDAVAIGVCHRVAASAPVVEVTVQVDRSKRTRILTHVHAEGHIRIGLEYPHSLNSCSSIPRPRPYRPKAQRSGW